MQRKKYILLASIVVLALTVGTAIAKADNDDENGNKNGNGLMKGIEKISERLERFELPAVDSLAANPPSIFVGPQGQTRIIGGEITTLGNATSSTDMIKVWGITLSVNTENAQFIPAGTSHAALKVGDKVSIKGTTTDSGIVLASVVHALSDRQRMVEELFSQVTKLIEKIRELQQKAGLPLTPFPAR